MATETLIIDVTQEDIDQGTPETTDGCPVALALKRMGFVEVMVDAGGIDVSRWEDKQSHMYGYAATTKKLGHWIQRFDDTGAVKPAKFKVVLDVTRYQGREI